MEPIIIKSSSISISPQKMNLVAGIIRRKDLDYSLKTLEFLPKKGGRILHKLLQGAAKNLEKSQENLSNFYLSKIEVNQGKTQKRAIYRAKGRTNRIRKRSSLINLYLSKKEVVAKAKPKYNLSHIKLKLVSPGQKLCGNYNYVGKGGCREAQEIGKPARQRAEQRLQEIERLDSVFTAKWYGKNYTAEEIATWEKCPPDIVEEFSRHEMGEILTSSESTTGNQLTKKQVELRKLKEKKGDNSEEIRQLEQEIEKLLKEQKVNSAAETPTKNNKIMTYSIIGFSLLTLIEERINLLRKDKLMRDYLYSLFPDICRLKTEYSRSKITVYLYMPEISLVLGENNSKLAEVMKGIYKIVDDDKIAVKVNLTEVKRIYTNAQSIANLIVGQLKKRTRSRQIIRNIAKMVSAEREIKGLAININGLIDASEIAQKKKFVQDRMKLSTIDSNIEGGRAQAFLSRGVVGVKYEGHAKGNQEVNFGEYGLQAQEGTYISNRAIEAARKVIRKTKKPLEVRMGSGKGSVESWVAVVKAGTVIFEVQGLPKELAYKVLAQVSYKLPKNNGDEQKPEVKKTLTFEELLAQYRSALTVLQMKSRMGQLVKTHQIKQIKKEIARLLAKKRWDILFLLETLEYYIEKLGVYPNFKKKQQLRNRITPELTLQKCSLANTEDTFRTQLILFLGAVCDTNNPPRTYAELRQENQEVFQQWLHNTGITVSNCPPKLKHFLLEIKEILEKQ
ncbi:2654_t:CDS:2, partial [Funneliformis geosporum]